MFLVGAQYQFIYYSTCKSISIKLWASDTYGQFSPVSDTCQSCARQEIAVMLSSQASQCYCFCPSPWPQPSHAAGCRMAHLAYQRCLSCEARTQNKGEIVALLCEYKIQDLLGAGEEWKWNVRVLGSSDVTHPCSFTFATHLQTVLAQ